MSGINSNTKLMLPFVGNNGAKEIVDVGNTGHVATLVGTANIDTSIINPFGNLKGVLSLDGNSDYVSFPASTDFQVFNSLSTTRTISTWVKMDTVVGGGEVICSNLLTGNDYWLITNIANGTNLNLDIRVGGAYQSISGSVGIVDTNWHHIAVIMINGTIGLYLDGIQIALAVLANITTHNQPLVIGQNSLGSGYFDGSISDFIIQNDNNIFSGNPSLGNDTIIVPSLPATTDSNTKILLPFTSHDISGDGGSGTYKSPSFVATAQIDDTITDMFGQSDGVLFGDGNSDSVNVTDDPDWDVWANTVDDWTIDGWVNLTGATLYTLIGQGNASTGEGWTVQIGSLGIRWSNQSVGGTVNTVSPFGGGDMNGQGWLHVVASKNGNVYSCYINGQQVSYLVSNNNATFSDSLTIMRDGGGRYLDGYVSELRLQKSNIFSANPNVGLTDTITVPTSRYDTGLTPDAPTGLTATTFNYDRIDLSWTAPSLPVGINIVGYKIERESPIGGGWATLVADTGTTSTVYSNTSLDAGTQYNYRVFAINNNSFISLPSNEADDTTDTSPPDAPTSLSTSRGSTIYTVDLSWVAPVDDGGSPITGYKIDRKELPSGDWATIVENTGNTNVVHTDNDEVICSKKYNYRVYTITLLGISIASNEDQSYPSNGVDANTGTLLNFQNENDSIIFRDSSQYDAVVTVLGDSKQTDEVTKPKFENSLLLPNDNFSGLSVPVNANNNFTAFNIPFTIDMYMYLNTKPTHNSLIYSSIGGGSNNMQFWHENDGSPSENIYFHYNGANRGHVNCNLPTGQWFHLAIVRVSNSLKLYINGNSVGSDTIDNTLGGAGSTVEIFSEYFDGYCGYYRISTVARWTSNFTPPSVPYGCPYVDPTSGLLDFNKITGEREKIDKSTGWVFDFYSGESYKKIN